MVGERLHNPAHESDADNRKVNVDEKMVELESYFEALKSRGERLPSRVSEEKPHFRLISAATGIDFSYLRKEPFRQRIMLAAEEIGFPLKEGTLKLRYAARFHQNYARLNNYLQWLKDNAFRLPEDPIRRGKVFFTQVVLEAGLSPHALTLKKSDGEQAYNVQLIQVVKKAASSIGIEVRVLPQSPGHKQIPFTYGELLERGTEERKKELTDSPSAGAQLSNTRYALNLFLEILGLEETNSIGKEFVTEFKESLEKATSSITNKHSRKKFQTEINRWREIHQRLLKGSSIPDDINQAISYLVARSGLSLTVFAKLIGTGHGAIKEWCEGIHTPALMSKEPLARMESLFKLPVGTLVSKISNWRGRKQFRLSELPPFLRQDMKLYRQISKHLPDNFCTLSLVRQEQIAESIRTDILHGDDDYTRQLKILIQLPYGLKEWPGPVRGEFDALANFKMADRPPLGMQRNGTWRPATKKKRENDLAYFFGALCLPAGADDVRLRGLGLAESQLTLALICCPMLVDWYIRFRCKARNQYTRYPIDLLKCFISMLRPATGWLRQNPHLAVRLRPFILNQTHYVPEDLVSRAQSDWHGLCDEAIGEYKKLILEIEPLVTVARDPFQRIEGILNMKNPMEPLGLMIQGMKKGLPNRHTQSVLYHTAIRDLALIILIVLTGLRRGTIAQLNYTGDKTGHLYLEGGSYVASVPRKFFKNPDSSFFGPKGKKTDYLNRLRDKFGLNEVLKEYLEESRPFLLKRYYGHISEQALFISAPTGTARAEPRSARISVARISGIFTNNVEKHLVENKHRGTGIPKVRRTGPHSVRHARGTKTYRKTRSFKLAGDANQNSERMARKHYSRITNEEVNLELNKILFDDDE